MNINEVKAGDRCWVPYPLGTIGTDKHGQNATVKESPSPIDGHITVEPDNWKVSIAYWGHNCFWTKPTPPPKPKRMVKKEVKGCVFASSLTDFVARDTFAITVFSEGNSKFVPVTLTWEDEE